MSRKTKRGHRTTKVDRRKWKKLSPTLTAAIQEYLDRSKAALAQEDVTNRIDAPLYHYTDMNGLEGIIGNQQVWFTHYQHLNDPTEVTYGMEVAAELIKEIGGRYTTRTKLFCDMANEFFAHPKIKETFGVFIGCFSRKSDDLDQWRAYGDDGRGFALGLSPSLFQVEDKADRKPHENVLVTPVAYGKQNGQERHRRAIEDAARIVESIVTSVPAVQNINVGMPFFDEMAKALVGSEMLWKSMTIKDEAYEREQEVRLIIVGEYKNLRPFMSERSRAGKMVPFIKSCMPIQATGSIVEVVIGPSATADAEERVRTLLRPFLDKPDSVIRRSKIPYRSMR
jgi:hypothetical protein